MLRVRMVQSRRLLYEGNASQVVLPGEAGEVAILEHHAPMVCVLTAGQVHIDAVRMTVRHGMASVDRNRLTIIAE